MLDKYLDELTKEAEALDEQKQLSKSLSELSAGELAKIAGIELPEGICENCGGPMTKTGSIMRCSCGMMKAAKEKEALLGTITGALAAEEGQRLKGALGGLGAGDVLGANIGAAPGVLLARSGMRRVGMPLAALGGLAGMIGGGYLGGKALTESPKTKAAAEKDNRSLAAILALPVAGAAGGGAIGSLISGARGGTKAMLPGLKGGALTGGAIGAGAAALIGLGSLLEKADPSGKILDTAVKLAPAVATVAGAASQRGQWEKVHGKKKEGAEAAAENMIDPGYIKGLAGAARAAGPGGILGPLAAGMGTSVGGTFAGAGIAKLLKRNPLAGGAIAAIPSLIGGWTLQEVLMRRGLARKGVKRDWGGTLFSPRHQFTPEAAAKYLKKEGADMPPFLKQDRPKKVKEIYKALKRDHPDMPAEMKARIAARQGKRGKQHQGPPYKGPLTKESGLWDFLTGSGEKRDKKMQEALEYAREQKAKGVKGYEYITPEDKKKAAAPISPEDFREAIQEARERVNPELMQKRYAIGGGAAGGLLGGGVGLGAAKLLGKGPLGMAIGGGLGALAGGTGGALLGRQLGGEEAQEEQLIQNMQTARGFQVGRSRGFQEGANLGLRRGALIGAAMYHRALQGNPPQGAAPEASPMLKNAALEWVLQAKKFKEKQAAAPPGFLKSMLQHPATLASGLGAVGGAGVGALGSERENALRNAAVGAVTGATLGAIAGLGARAMGEGSLTARAAGQKAGYDAGLAEGAEPGKALLGHIRSALGPEWSKRLAEMATQGAQAGSEAAGKGENLLSKVKDIFGKMV